MRSTGAIVTGSPIIRAQTTSVPASLRAPAIDHTLHVPLCRWAAEDDVAGATASLTLAVPFRWDARSNVRSLGSRRRRSSRSHGGNRARLRARPRYETVIDQLSPLDLGKRGLKGSCPEACGKSERVFRSRRSHFCVTRMASGRLLLAGPFDYV